ncbi:TetR/AcrR family transcriptional regulator [Nocardia panacis]|uniref:TetR/AcrR family transcriptional regulator n=1 Tax=Nocardia panacis TaxID=2340916 RepID=A0A3A4L0F8_9NOCA|nr:TetR/AcrR family transcriptional regulator [Nocardia panacis]RJO75257.1 TetR/AcrR family transcriptional regulator [Nocardia panacis]
MPESVTRRRAPAGAAVMQPQVTAAITEAALAELAEVGYGKLSMEAIARRAAVSKPTLYRRWPTKERLVMALITQVAVAAAEVPDTGDLRGDLIAFLDTNIRGLSHPQAARIIPDLLAEAGRNPVLREALQTDIGRTRRAKVVELLRRAIDRGELPADLDIELALDFLAAPTFWRSLTGGDITEPGYLDRLVEMIIGALRA